MGIANMFKKAKGKKEKPQVKEAEKKVIVNKSERSLFHAEMICSAISQLQKYEQKKYIPKIEAIYDYKDEKGKLIYQVVRYSPKLFKIRKSDGKGGWVYCDKTSNTKLYNLKDVISSEF